MVSKAESWMYEGRDDDGVQVFLDLDSITRVTPESDIVSFKIKADLPTVKSSYVIGSVDVNCKLKEARTTDLVLVEGNKSTNKNEDSDLHWAPIPENDAIWGRILELVCREHAVK
jgi:hypothetical protein